MHIGLTYDLITDYLQKGYSEEDTAEFDTEDTIDSINNALQNLGFKTERIGNFHNLLTCLVNGKRWDMVFNICEGLYGMGRECLVPALLDQYQIPYVFSDPLVLCITLNKGMAKRVVRDLKLPTPDFFVVEEENDLTDLRLGYPLFVKPVAEGSGKGIDEHSIVANNRDLKTVCLALLKKFRQPVLVEEYLPGSEFTVGIVGTGKDSRVIGVLEIMYTRCAQSEVYSYLHKKHYQRFIKHRLVADKALVKKCADLSLRVWNGIGGRDAGRVDLRLDKNGEPCFIEVNPLAGLNPDSDLPMLARFNGITYQSLLEMIMESALKRTAKFASVN
ncbi:MAG: D-alanine--D-alanine ligase family protein [Syntrophomonadales bacterium]|jgi:D-alanine-D-alanine ligase